ncbi:MAG: hypothetical protein SPK28_04570 [Bacilli bacterium]|nr:hypothetical protein [Bacilli bacterium]
MLDTIIITVLGIIVVIQNIYITKLDYKLDIFDELHKYHNELVSITEKYINKEIDIVEYNYLINDVNECIKVLESDYDEYKE